MELQSRSLQVVLTRTTRVASAIALRELLLGLALLLPLLPQMTSAQGLPASPCPALFSYETDQNGQIVGLIRLLTPARYAEVRLIARLSSPVPVQRHEVGDLQLKGGRDAAMEATRSVLAARRHTLHYHLRFPPGKPTPTLLALQVNDVEICSRPQGAPANSRSTITLQSFLKTGVGGAPQVAGHEFGAPGGGSPRPTGGDFGTFIPEVEPPPQPQRPLPQRPNPIRPPPPLPSPKPLDPEPWPDPETTRRPRPPITHRPPPIDESELQENVLDPTRCGTAPLHNALIFFGEEAKLGQWPWQTAIFKNNDSESFSVTLQFQCGGTLVSRRHVITAGHCVVMVKERRKVQLIANSDLLISLGKYNIRNWAEQDQQLKEVQKIILHPQYNPEDLRNDISIILLSTSITVNGYVKPICLWDQNNDLNNIVGEVGTVGGWGRDETGSLSDKLRIATMPIVSQETCLRSDNNFYIKYTSENTFCAGFRNGTTVCNGDSGGGLHLKLDNPHQRGQKTWYLRGVVSLSMLEVGEQTCDAHNFVVFTDVAKYMNWVKQQLQT